MDYDEQGMNAAERAIEPIKSSLGSFFVVYLSILFDRYPDESQLIPTRIVTEFTALIRLKSC